MARPMASYDGSCHCGAVSFTIETDFPELTTCDCSICRRKNALMVRVPEDRMTLHSGSENLAEYRFHTGTARHFFCKTCGIYTHHQRRSNPNQYGVNVACLEGVSPFDFVEVPVLDGVNHPNDNHGRAGRVGTLRFDPSND